MKRNDINEIKEKIRELIRERNRDYIAGVGDDQRKLEISRDDFRRVDRKTTVDGRRTWLAKIVVKEMVAAGELVVENSFLAAGRKKVYRLTGHKQPAGKWTPDMDFMAGYDCGEIVTNSHDEWLGHFYGSAEIQELARECKLRAKNKRYRATGNAYSYDGDDWRRGYYFGED